MRAARQMSGPVLIPEDFWADGAAGAWWAVRWSPAFWLDPFRPIAFCKPAVLRVLREGRGLTNP